MADGPSGNEVKLAGVYWNIFHATMENVHVIEFDPSRDFRQERTFLGVRLY